ncbi:MAG: hypothetical protein E4H36_09765, partial [Spirochaetales bacterium]
VARLRARNEITEIRANALKLDRSETAFFLNRVMELNLTEENIAALETRTEGWLSGLQLAALAVRDMQTSGESRDVDGFVREFSGTHRYIFDFLAEEVLRLLPPDIRSFLIRTSVLKRLCAPLCGALTGRAGSADLLRQLAGKNLFLQALDTGGTWYRYHELFADFLKSNLTGEEEAGLHLAAAGWLGENNFLEEAVDHALSSGDFGEAAGMIVSAADEVIRRGSFATLQNWIRALPDGTVHSSCGLSILAGFLCIFANRYEEAEAYGEAAAKLIDDTIPPSVRGRLKSLQAHFKLCSADSESSARLSREALDCLAADDFFFRDLTTNLLGQSLELRGDLRSAVEAYLGAVAGKPDGAERGANIITLINLVFLLNRLGRRSEALAVCRDCDMNASTGGGPGFIGDALCLGLGLLSLEVNDLDKAYSQILRALALSEQANIVDGIVWGRYILSIILLARGETDKALGIIRAAGKLPTSGAPHRGWFLALELEAALRTGDTAAARQLADPKRLVSFGVPDYWNDPPYLSYCRFLISEGRLADAAPILLELGRSAEAGGRNRTLISVWLLKARVEQASGRDRDALGLVQRALKLASPEGYVRAFADEMPGLLPLFEKMRETDPRFTDAVMAAHRAEKVVSQTGSTGRSVPSFHGTRGEPPVEPLTERELDVLRLVANGLSNAGIAEALFVSVGTVKKHLNNIFGKLDAGNRTQAVVRARELNLIV